MSIKSFDDLSSVIRDEGILHGMWLTWDDSEQLAKSLRDKFDDAVTAEQISEAIESYRPIVMKREENESDALAKTVLDLQKRVEALEQTLKKSGRTKSMPTSTASKKRIATPSKSPANKSAAA